MAIVMALVARPAQAQSARPSVILPGFVGVAFLDTIGAVRNFRAPPAQVFAALRTVFAESGITVQEDEAKGLIGNLVIKTQRRFTGTRMSVLLDCGIRDKGPNADFYRIHLAVMAMVQGLDNGTTNVRMAFAAGAQDFAGPLADPVSCSSTGKLEDRMLNLVSLYLKTG